MFIKSDYESSRVEDLRDYLLEALGEEKALKTVDNTIAVTEGRLAEKADRARRVRDEVENSSFEVDEMLRAQHDVDAADAEVAALQKCVIIGRRLGLLWEVKKLIILN